MRNPTTTCGWDLSIFSTHTYHRHTPGTRRGQPVPCIWHDHWPHSRTMRPRCGCTARVRNRRRRANGTYRSLRHTHVSSAHFRNPVADDLSPISDMTTQPHSCTLAARCATRRRRRADGTYRSFRHTHVSTTHSRNPSRTACPMYLARPFTT